MGVKKHLLLGICVFLLVLSLLRNNDDGMPKKTGQREPIGTAGTSVVKQHDEEFQVPSGTSTPSARREVNVPEKEYRMVEASKADTSPMRATRHTAEVGERQPVHPPIDVQPQDMADPVSFPASMWRDHPDLRINFPEGTQYVIIEVGTNAQPSYVSVARESPGAFLIGLEPVSASRAAQSCTCLSGGKCKILQFAVGPRDQRAVMNARFGSDCSSFLPLSAPCNRNQRKWDTKVIRLDTLIAYTLPPDMPIRILMLSAQGFDLYGAASLTNKHFIQHRIANLILECQDLPVGDSRFIAKGGRSCGEAVSCIKKHWGYVFVGCTQSKAETQYNCMFYNPDLEEGEPTLRTPDGESLPIKLRLDYPTECPAMFTDTKLMPKLPAPTSNSADDYEKPRTRPVSPDAVVVRPKSMWADDPELLNVTYPEDAEYAIIEVGTDTKPDYLSVARDFPGVFLIGLEPLMHKMAAATCRCYGQGKCKMFNFAVGPHEQKAVMNKVTTSSECSSLLPLKYPNMKVHCEHNVGTQDVKVIRLDTLIAYALPPDMPIRILMLDMQGFDLYGAASLTEKHFIKNRVANLLLECQDLPVRDSRFIAKGAASCGQAVSCITKHWGYKFVGCSRNKNPMEYNCGFYNPDHEDRQTKLRHRYKKRFKNHVDHPADCPAAFTDISQAPQPQPSIDTAPSTVTKPLVTPLRPESMWSQEPSLRVSPTKGTQYAIVEVGSGKEPRYIHFTSDTIGAFLLAVEPTATRKSANACHCFGGGKCAIVPFAIGPHEQAATVRAASATACSSLLPLTDRFKATCRSRLLRKVVKVIRLDTLIAYALPPDMPVRILMLDMQGFDLYGAASLTEKHFIKNRVANLILECQDLPVDSPRFIAKGARSCGEAISCITQHWGYKFVGCTPHKLEKEYNCMFYNPDHEDGDEHLRPPQSARDSLKIGVEHPAECPAMFTDTKLIPKLPAPTSSSADGDEQPRTRPVSPDAVVVRPKSMWADDPELLNVTYPEDAEYAIIEVGTNIMPDYIPTLRGSPNAFLIGMEPLVTKKTIGTCDCYGDGRAKVLKFAVGPHEQRAVMNVAASTVCSSLLPLNSSDPKVRCTRKSGTRVVKVLRLDTLIAYALPPDMPVRILMLDMQGFDLHGASSLTEKHFINKRVANFLIECQDYPPNDTRFLVQGAKSCGEVISCITQHWRYKFVGCTKNLGPKEFNCMFYNPEHKDGDPQLRHPFLMKDDVIKKKMDFPARCPAMFTNASLVPKLPTP